MSLKFSHTIDIDQQKKNIGRNDLCPCGSGKKYKKCCLLDESSYDRNEKSRLLSQMVDWVTSQSWFEASFTQHLHQIVGSIDTIDESQLKVLMESFIFEVVVEKLQTPLVLFIQNKSSTDPDRAEYIHWYEQTVFSLFLIQSIQLGKSMEMLDLTNNHKYRVHERMATYGLKVGDVLATRLVTQGQLWVMTGGSVRSWTGEQAETITQSMARLQKQSRSDGSNFSVSEVDFVRWEANSPPFAGEVNPFDELFVSEDSESELIEAGLRQVLSEPNVTALVVPLGSDLTYDALQFLTVIAHNPLPLTKVYRNLTRKTVLAINQLLQQPDAEYSTFEGKIFSKHHHQWEFPKIHWLVQVMRAGKFVKEKDTTLVLTRKGQKLRTATERELWMTLLHCWLVETNWLALEPTTPYWHSSLSSSVVEAVEVHSPLLFIHIHRVAQPFSAVNLTNKSTTTPKDVDAHIDMLFTTYIERGVLQFLVWFGLLEEQEDLAKMKQKNTVFIQPKLYAMTTAGAKFFHSFDKLFSETGCVIG